MTRFAVRHILFWLGLDERINAKFYPIVIKNQRQPFKDYHKVTY